MCLQTNTHCPGANSLKPGARAREARLIFSRAVTSKASRLAFALTSWARANSAPAASCSEAGRTRSCHPGTARASSERMSW
eukprot:6872679-Pyramimonas_sp.AAC.1